MTPLKPDDVSKLKVEVLVSFPGPDDWRDQDAEEYNEVAAGQVLIITSGDYSDYQIQAVYVATKDFSFKEATRLFMAINNLDVFQHHNEFLGYLENTMKAVINIYTKEFNLDDY